MTIATKLLRPSFLWAAAGGGGAEEPDDEAGAAAAAAELDEAPEVVETPEEPEAAKPPAFDPAALTPEQLQQIAQAHGLVRQPVQQQQATTQTQTQREPTDDEAYNYFLEQTEVANGGVWADENKATRDFTSWKNNQLMARLARQEDMLAAQAIRPQVEAELEKSGVPKEEAANFMAAKACINREACTVAGVYNEALHNELATAFMVGHHTRKQGKLPGDPNTEAAAKGRKPQNPQADAGDPVTSGNAGASFKGQEESNFQNWRGTWYPGQPVTAAMRKEFKDLG